MWPEVRWLVVVGLVSAPRGCHLVVTWKALPILSPTWVFLVLQGKSDFSSRRIGGMETIPDHSLWSLDEGSLWAAGQQSQQHLAVLDKTIAEAPAPDRDRVEAELLEWVDKVTGPGFRELGQRILQLLDQDGKPPKDPELAEPKREFHHTSRKDGSMVFRGKLDSESAAKLEAMLSPMAKPTSAADTRTTAQREGDALAEIIDLAAGSDDLPEEGLALTMSLNDFLAQKGTAEMEGGGPINAASARRLACDSTVLRVVLGAKSQPLDIGRATRTIPNHIRRALIIRDRGCAFPGCYRRPRQCHAHHVIHWADGGPPASTTSSYSAARTIGTSITATGP
jgi:hypothetical protein